MAEQALRRHDHERLPEATMNLPAQRVEDLGRRRRVHDLTISPGAELEKSLESRARVIRTLALVAVREQQHEPAHALPLRFRARDELVDHHLRAVGEIAELR